MARTPYGLPRPGSTAWAAKKVERILDHEAKDRQTETRRRWAEEARPFKVRDHPVGGDSWAAQQIRLIRQREARARLGLEATRARPARTAAAEVGIGPIVSRRDEVGPAVGSAFAGAPPSAGLLSAYAAPDRAAVAPGKDGGDEDADATTRRSPRHSSRGGPGAGATVDRRAGAVVARRSRGRPRSRTIPERRHARGRRLLLPQMARGAGSVFSMAEEMGARLSRTRQ